MRHDGADALADRGIAEPGEVVLDHGVTHAAIPGAVIDAGIAIRDLEVTQIDVDPIVATQRLVGQRPGEAARTKVRERLLAGGGDLGHEVRNPITVRVERRRRIGTGRREVDEHHAAGDAERLLSVEDGSRRGGRRPQHAGRDREPDHGSCFHSTA